MSKRDKNKKRFRKQQNAANREWQKQNAVDCFVAKLLKEDEDVGTPLGGKAKKSSGRNHKAYRADLAKPGKLTPFQSLAVKLNGGEVKKTRAIRRPAREIKKYYFPSEGLACLYLPRESEAPPQAGWRWSGSLRCWVKLS